MRSSLSLSAGLLVGTLTGLGQVTSVTRPDMTGTNAFYVGNRPPLQPSPFLKLPIGAITPRGWLRHQLDLEARGMEGRLPEVSHWLKLDGNGWIDSGDTSYASLRLWSGPDAAMRSLPEAGGSALYVGASIATKFDLRSGTNEALGQVISSSVYLADSGRPGALQQVDLTA